MLGCGAAVPFGVPAIAAEERVVMTDRSGPCAPKLDGSCAEISRMMFCSCLWLALASSLCSLLCRRSIKRLVKHARNGGLGVPGPTASQGEGTSSYTRTLRTSMDDNWV